MDNVKNICIDMILGRFNPNLFNPKPINKLSDQPSDQSSEQISDEETTVKNNSDQTFITNEIFNVNKQLIDTYIENIILHVDKNIANSLIKLLNKILSNNGITYNSLFLNEYIIVSKKIFNNFYSYNFKLHKLDDRPYSDTNNETILFTKLFCFSYVLKILSEKKNSLNGIMVEINNSKFFNQLVLENVCPHFATYVTDYHVNNSINNIKLKTNNNHCLVYHYINSWKMNLIDTIHKIPDMSCLLNILLKFNKSFEQSVIDDILYCALFQVFYSILTMGSYRINHNDLRASNILLHGNYVNTDKYDKYVIYYLDEVLTYYIPNYGFKIKIIDYGLTHSDIGIGSGLNNSKSINYDITNEAGIYPYYSEYSDQHYFVNELLSRKIKTISPNICSFLKTIVDPTFIGTGKNNMYLCEYWRLGFPYTINYFISRLKDDFNINNICDEIKTSNYDICKFPQDILSTIKKICLTELNYDADNRLIHNQELIDNLIKFIKFMADVESLNTSIHNILSNPFDNCKNMILTPIDIIKKFNMYTNVISDDKIQNTYELYI